MRTEIACYPGDVYHVYRARSRFGKAFVGYTTDMQRTVIEKNIEHWLITYSTVDLADAVRRARTQEIYEIW